LYAREWPLCHDLLRLSLCSGDLFYYKLFYFLEMVLGVRQRWLHTVVQLGKGIRPDLLLYSDCLTDLHCCYGYEFEVFVLWDLRSHIFDPTNFTNKTPSSSESSSLFIPVAIVEVDRHLFQTGAKVTLRRSNQLDLIFGLFLPVTFLGYLQTICSPWSCYAVVASP
jgi:hypothetical protein